ncbi:hypothetical protein [Cellulomonas sp. ATA003]|uniref:hypothetical protein n=1 Tax=Cellulomonas sp. ATA003 TaxID=3073064 RepID=UPI002873DEA1|nr:hypothetical protein [Cellulomonas sp. ATA003]WNB85556.1 hypothetical protein REH70_18735 [Cellulomonas sp. ATA003]
MTTPDDLRRVLRSEADAAGALDHDAIWAQVATGIHRRRRRRRTAAVIGTAAAVAAIAVGVPALDRVDLPTWPAPVATAPPAPAPTTPTPEPSTTPDPTKTPSSAVTIPVPTEVLAPALLEPRTTTDGTVAWALPEECAAGSPSTATAMLTARDGTGEFEARIDVQQVALFADAATAVAEADRVRAALAACDASSELISTETVEVGAQGTGVARVYGDGEGAPTPFGTYAVLTRRGSALALATVDGGDGSTESSREPVTQRARQLWERLCGYESAGC